MIGSWMLAVNEVAAAWAEAILRASWQGGLALAAVWLASRAFRASLPAPSPGSGALPI